MILAFTLAHALDVDRVVPAGSAYSSAGTALRPAPFVDPQGDYYLGAISTIANAPLRLGGTPVVTQEFGVDLAFGGVVLPRLRVDASLGMVPGLRYDHQEYTLDLNELELGDLRLGAALGIVTPKETGLGLALEAQARFPTGGPFFQRGWGGVGRLVSGGRYAGFGWNVDAGADYAPDDATWLGRAVGTRIQGGAGVHVWPIEQVVVGVEADAEHALAPTGETAANAAEWNGYVGYTPCTGAQLAIGGGSTLVPGVGTPDWRFILSFGFYRGDCSFSRTAPNVPIPPLPHPLPKVRTDKTQGVAPVLAAPRAELRESEIVILDRVEFAFRSARLLPEALPILDDVAAVMLAHPELTLLEVAGHTDSRGGVAFNQKLSEARAAEVMAWLVRAGVAPDRLRARGYGEATPLIAQENEAAWAKNRRVEFRVLRKEGAR